MIFALVSDAKIKSFQKTSLIINASFRLLLSSRDANELCLLYRMGERREGLCASPLSGAISYPKQSQTKL